MNFKIYNGSTSEEIPRALIYEMFFQVDILNIYSKATVKIHDPTSTLYNSIKTGQQMIIEFTDTGEDENPKNYMMVLSYQKKRQSSQNNIIEDIEIKLISSWYFDATVGDATYFGTFSEIVENIISKSNRPYFSGTDFNATEDGSRYRYRIGETEQDFIQRIMKYGMKGNLPVYLYMNASGQLVLRGIKDFINEKATLALSPDMTIQLGNLPANAKDYSNLRISSYNIVADLENAHSRMTCYLTTSNFKMPEDASVPTSATLVNTELNNPQSLMKSPEIRIYSNWNRTPDDALAIGIKNIFEKNLSNYYMIAIIPAWVPFIDLGTKFKVFLPYAPVEDPITGKTSNLGEGEYFTKHITLIFKDNLYKTKLSLIQALY